MKPLLNIGEVLTFANVANIASILGFGITLYVAATVGRLKRHYLLTARAPELVQRVSELASRLIGYANDVSAYWNDVHLDLARLDVALKSLEAKVPRTQKKAIHQLRGHVAKYQPAPAAGSKGAVVATGSATGEEGLRAIYVATVKLVEELGELHEDSKWR